MKIKIIIWLVVWVLLVVSNVYGAALRGKIVLANSGGKPVLNAQLTAFGANPGVSTSAGLFQLDFPEKNPGDVVMVIVQKKGFEVINKKDLERVVLRQNPDEILEIVMCPEGEWQKNAAVYFGIATKAINEEFDKRLKKIETEIIGGKEAEIRRLTEERDAALAQAKPMAEEFAQVNLDEASDLYKEAFCYFSQGDIDEAYAFLSDVKMDLDLHNARKLKEKADSAIKQSSNNYVFKAKLAILKYRFVEAEGYYDKALETDPENLDNYYEFSTFLWNQKNFQKAEEICNKALSIKMDDESKAMLLNNLGALYYSTARLKEAEKSYAEALEIYRQLAATNLSAYLPDVAMTLNNLGALYYSTTRFTEAEKAYAEALKIYRQLTATNPSAYLPDVAMTLNNLGVLYNATTRFAEAEKAYAEALEIYRQLAAINSSAYLSAVSDTLNNLGALYYSTTRLKEAEKAYTEALEIYRQLAATNPSAYLSVVADTLNNLGALYSDTTRLKEAEKAYAEALEIRRQLAATNPSAYLSVVAGTLNNLGVLYKATTRFTEAEKAYAEALEIYRQLAAANPAAYLPDVGMTLNNLGVLYKDTTRFTEAEKACAEALEIRRQLAATNPAAYLSFVATTLNNLGLLNINHKKYADALSNFREALSIRKKLAAISPPAFDLDLCQTILSMAFLYTISPDACAELKEEIPSLLDRAITILKKYPDNPQVLQILKYAEQLKNKIK